MARRGSFKSGKRGKHQRYPVKYCGAEKKVILRTELDAKLALATRMYLDRGEKRYYKCYLGVKPHYHLTSQEADPGRTQRNGE